MKVYINPYKRFHGSFVPEWLERMKDITPGAKICYARLCRYAGKNGVAYPKNETLADAIGVSDRQIRRYISELEEHGLIESKQRGFGKPNLYYFLDHKVMDATMTEQERTDTSEPDRTYTSGQDWTSTSVPYIEENHFEENQTNIEREADAFTEVMRYYRSKVNNRWEVSPNGKYRKRLQDLIHQGRAIADIKKVIDHRFAELENGLPQYLVEPDNIFKPDLFLKTLNAANFKPAQKPKAVNGKNSGIELASADDFQDKPDGWENY